MFKIGYGWDERLIPDISGAVDDELSPGDDLERKIVNEFELIEFDE